jgi:nicotinate-nucleotide adenylyltransferase
MTPVGVFGGTFDPLHYGHLTPVEEVRRQLGIPEVRMIPCASPPHRRAPQASAAQRKRMLELALPEFPALRLDDRELRMGGTSYTVRTLESLRAELGAVSLCLFLGMDQFLAFDSWYRWQDITGLAHLVVMQRPGWPLPKDLEKRCPWARDSLISDPGRLAESVAGFVIIQETSLLDISATELRRAIARGEDVSQWLPPAVWAYIQEQKLYRA